MVSEDQPRRRAPRIQRSPRKTASEERLSFKPEWPPGLTDKEMQHEMGPITQYDDPT